MSAIAKNASITLLTGVPGNGKTLRAVWYMREAIKAKEQVFCANLNGLRIPEVIDFPDPTKWEDLPAGSILVVDEAQKFFRAKAGLPDYIAAMEEIRHRGIRLILITQHPALIHGNIRALVGLHEHLVRENGRQSSTVYRRSRVIDNVRSDRSLQAEDHETWSFPSECFDLYKSAEVHTVKRTISSKYKRTLALVLLAVAIFGGVAWYLRDVGKADTPAKPSRDASAPAGAFGSARPSKDAGPKWVDASDYARAHLPRLKSMPWSAEVFDGRSVTADPELFCMSSSAGPGAGGEQLDWSCTCMTEQGTLYEMDLHWCRKVARNGPDYNPYKEARQHAVGEEASDSAQAQEPVVSSPLAMALPTGRNSTKSMPENKGFECETCETGELK